ncbi:MAG: TonB-dependent receptor [Bacteroidales bacterium]|nr:TonB-dependent receptor [Lentimicrobiaceae bacterium]MDD5695324.1 TonB-dependent receptor [Bacteroidales bacterium]
MKHIFVLLLFTTISVQAFAQTGSIRGRVFDATTNEPLPFTNMIVWGEPTIGSVSDLDGNFIFTAIKPGFARLQVTSVGYEDKITEEIQVINNKETYIDIPMTPLVVQLQGVVVTVSPFMKNDESPLSMQTLGISEIEKNPGGNRDISKVVQVLPGVGATPFGFRNDLIVRGGGPSENRFYLDDIEIPYLNHFSTQGASGGPTGILNVDFVREVNFYSGAFPADRGNAMSSVLEFKQKEGNRDKVKFRATVGASDLGLTLDGPMGEKTNFIFSVRRSYLQLLFSVLELPFLPTYNDYQFKIKHDFDKKNQLSIISVGALDNSKLNTGIKDPTDDQKYLLGYLPVNEQWSYTIGAVYKHFGDKGYHTLVLSRNMLNNVAYKYEDNDEDDPAKKLLDLQSQEIENKLRYEKNITLSGYRLNYGAGVEYAKYNIENFQKVFIANEQQILDQYSSIDLFKYSLFGQVSKGYVRDRLTLSLGLRMDGSSYSKEVANPLEQISPRFSASYSLTKQFYLNFNTGRFYQLPPYTMLGHRNNEGTLVNKDLGLKYIYVDQLVGGVEYRPNDDARLTVEGFYKHYADYPFSVTDSVSMASKGADFGIYGDEAVTSTSKGRTYGLEIYFRDTDLMGFNILASYTLVRSEFTDLKQAYIPSAWDNKHLFNITVIRQFGKNWNAGIKWRFAGGAPYSPADLDKSSLIEAWEVNNRAIPDYDLYNTLRLSRFHQLDVRVDKEFFFKKWSLNLYIDIQNVYNFKAETAPDYTNLDTNGIPVINPTDPTRYVLRKIGNDTGTVLPTIGVIVEF